MYQGCFCYLVNHEARVIESCVYSLRSLGHNYLRYHRAPVFLFHEEGLTTDMQRRIVIDSRTPVEFVKVKFETPTYVKEITTEWRLGYLHMCRFFTKTIFEHPLLDDFKYYCRMDTDSFILSPVEFNIFNEMDKRKASYGYITEHTDPPYVVTGLTAASQAFVDRHVDIPMYGKLGQTIREGGLYYNNFEVCRIEWFRRVPWVLYADAIDQAGGIYKYRWGDAPIRYIGVKLYMSPEAIHRFNNIHYKHIREYNIPMSTMETVI